MFIIRVTGKSVKTSYNEPIGNFAVNWHPYLDVWNNNFFVACIKKTRNYYTIKNYVPNEHVTPASSEWPQLCLPMGDFLQSKRSLSVPSHKTSSIQIWPVPWPKDADKFGMAFSLLKIDKQYTSDILFLANLNKRATYLSINFPTVSILSLTP